MTTFLFRCALILTLTCLMGCGKSGPGRLHVFGTVTWKGQPVPSGVVMFSPDSSKGTRGPDGFAVIVDGKYDSTSTTSKGCVAGAQIVSIIGGDGVNKRPRHAYGKLLFDTHRTTTTIPQEGGKIDFVIPDDVKPAPAKSDDAE